MRRRVSPSLSSCLAFGSLLLCGLLLAIGLLLVPGCGTDDGGIAPTADESIAPTAGSTGLVSEVGLGSESESSSSEQPTSWTPDEESDTLVFCETEEDCPLGFCVPLDDAGEFGVCVRSCVNRSDCPEGFSCGRFSADRDQPSICLPETFCLDEDEDGFGIGPGCDGPDCDDTNPDINPGAVERCDGRDTNCNGRVDDFPVYGTWQGEEVRIGEACDTGESGRCAAGTWQCLNGETFCVALQGPLPEETCSGVDDTCDGYADATAEGPLRRTRFSGDAAQQDTGECRPEIERCEAGAWVRLQNEQLPTEEQCDELDRSCSGDPYDVPAERLASDADHCGECGNRCDPPRLCIEGECRCDDDLLACEEACVDESSDPQHCGECDRVCGPGKFCVEGECLCPGGGLFCDGACIDPLTSLLHCGACGNDCDPAQLCIQGGCRCPSSSDSLCGGQCVNTQQDRNHCGVCDRVCADDQTCVNGDCRCPGGQTLCGDRCVDTDASNTHCGQCNNSCTGDQTCVNGDCRCPGGQTLCGDRCVDTDASNTHCGQCNNSCTGDQTCVNGNCRCPGGQTLCGDRCVDTDASNTHCGQCDNSCTGDQTCVNGDCRCPGGQTLCGDRCVDTDASNTHCGQCNNPCTGDLLCQSGNCRCPGTLRPCADQCVSEPIGESCYTLGGTPGQGPCSAGTWTCTAGNSATCAGQSGPQARVCDGSDNNCNGTVDDGCPGGVSLGAGTVGPVFGGNGGDAFERLCDDDEVVVGFLVRHGGRIDRLQVRCATPTLQTSTVAIPYTYTLSTGTGFRSLPPVGDTGGSEATYRCPSGTAVYRVSGKSGGEVDAFRIHCASWAYNGSPGSFSITRTAAFQSPQYGGTGGGDFGYSCPGNGALVGLIGRAGRRVDRIQPVCSVLNPTLR